MAPSAPAPHCGVVVCAVPSVYAVASAVWALSGHGGHPVIYFAPAQAFDAHAHVDRGGQALLRVSPSAALLLDGCEGRMSATLRTLRVGRVRPRWAGVRYQVRLRGAALDRALAVADGAPQTERPGASTSRGPLRPDEPRGSLPALTLYRPWPWAIFHLPPQVAKRVENREWRPRGRIEGRWVAIHAGAQFQADALGFIHDVGGVPPPSTESAHPRGIIGVVRMVGWVAIGIAAHEDEAAPGWVRNALASPWTVGSYAWVWDRAVALSEPVMCAGEPGLWYPPRSIEAAVKGRLTSGDGERLGRVAW